MKHQDRDRQERVTEQLKTGGGGGGKKGIQNDVRK